MTKLLSGETETGKKKFIPLSNEEKTLISAFIGDEDHVMKMSEGIIEGDQIRVLKGPLQGYEALVAKVDRHKRLARVRPVLHGYRESEAPSAFSGISKEAAYATGKPRASMRCCVLSPGCTKRGGAFAWF